MAIGMIAPVNVAANDEYLNFDQDSIYAIVSTTTGKALILKQLAGHHLQKQMVNIMLRQIK